jgi:hypothetical protein
MQNGGNNEKKVARGVNNEVLSEGGGGIPFFGGDIIFGPK